MEKRPGGGGAGGRGERGRGGRGRGGKGRGGKINRRIVTVNRRQITPIFSETVELVSFGDTVLENGENEYPFSITIPDDAPSSFHHLIERSIFGKNHGEYKLPISFYCTYT